MWYREIRKRGLPLTLFILSASIEEPFVAAQTRVETLEEMGAQLSPGQRVTLVKTNGESMIGRFTRLDERSVELSVDVDVAPQQRRRTDLVVMRDAIQSLERKKDPSSNGAKIGAGIGAGFALTLFAVALAQDANEFDEWGTSYLAFGGVTTGLGALTGWAIDALHSKPHLKYEKSSEGRLRFHTMPMLTRNTRGFSITVSY